MTKAVTRDPTNDKIVNVGDDYRIEPGPPLIKATATADLLHNDNTAPHYFLPKDLGGGRKQYSKDATGKPIQEGEEFSYLDWGGDKAEGKRVFYLYKKTPVNSVDEFIDGEANPNFVADHVREAAKAGDRGDDRVFYDYKWEEVGTFDTEESAIAACK